ncbi:MAG: GTPase [Leptospiraceae bacterium]|nr:MAG: GTPase [Leptospiraceae bacterium]
MSYFEVYIEKVFNNQPNQIFVYNFTLEKGDLLGIFGNSGAGKTLLLRLISGLDAPTKGIIKFHDDIWFDSNKKIYLPIQKRNIGFVFQNYNLFPHLKIEKQILFSLKNKKNIDQNYFNYLIDKFEIRNILNFYPHQISGGQRQRVAIAQMLLKQPKLLLLDEPFSALDSNLRYKLIDLIKAIHKEFKQTIIIVSHEKSDLLSLCNKVIYIEKGRIIESGSPNEIFFKNKLSAKLAITGKLIRLEKKDVFFIAYIALENDIIQVIINPEKAKNLTPGQHIKIITKAFQLDILEDSY